MSEQLTLDRLDAVHPPSARPSDPDTSALAAASVDPTQLRALQVRQLHLLAFRPDTHVGLRSRYDARWRDDPVSDSGFRTRIAELVAAGFVRDSGARATLPSGRHAVVWEITVDGIDAMRNNRNPYDHDAPRAVAS